MCKCTNLDQLTSLQWVNRAIASPVASIGLSILELVLVRTRYRATWTDMDLTSLVDSGGLSLPYNILSVAPSWNSAPLHKECTAIML